VLASSKERRPVPLSVPFPIMHSSYAEPPWSFATTKVGEGKTQVVVVEPRIVVAIWSQSQYKLPSERREYEG
jgi:hypothetical protein